MAKTPRKSSEERKACDAFRYALDDRMRCPDTFDLEASLRSLTRRVYATDTSASPTA